MLTTSSPVIIVTGASKGLGLSITRILLSSTFSTKVIAISRTLSEELRSLQTSHASTSSTSSAPKEGNEGDLVFVQGDVADERVSTEAVRVALDKWGRLDGLILNAGTIDPLGPISNPENTPTQWSESFRTNLFSLVAMLQASTPYLRGRPISNDHDHADDDADHTDNDNDHHDKGEEGRRKGKGQGGNVVFVSSGAATGNTAGWGCYNATKAALNSLCRTYANEERSIASFAVRPGMVDTEMQTKLRAIGPKGMLPEEMERFVNAHKEGKLLKPEDPGYVIAALAVKGQQVRDLSGQFLSWNDASLAAYQRPQ